MLRKYIRNLNKESFFTALFFLSVFCFGKQNVSFDSQRSFSYLKEQCNIGTREPSSKGHKRAKKYFESFLKKQNGIYFRDDFVFHDKKRNKKLDLTNFHIIFKGKTKKRIILCAHWDTRPWADRDKNRSNFNIPIIGANDGASGIAVLMEMCNIFSKHKPSKTIEVIFFDGEDYGMGNDGLWFLGSKHFAKNVDPNNYIYAVLIDMIGDSDLSIPKEKHSIENAPFLVEKIWSIAKKININEFKDYVGYAVLDDHIPLIRAGIFAVDIIDFEYKYWHTLEDTPDKCSPESLSKIGRVLTHLIYE